MPGTTDLVITNKSERYVYLRKRESIFYSFHLGHGLSII